MPLSDDDLMRALTDAVAVVDTVLPPLHNLDGSTDTDRAGMRAAALGVAFRAILEAS